MSNRIPAGYEESKSDHQVTLRYVRWPPVLAGFILIPWLISWSIVTPVVWSSYLHDDATWSRDGHAASLGDALGFSFFWIFGFSLFCILYIRKNEFIFEDDRFVRRNGCNLIYYETIADLGSIREIRQTARRIETSGGSTQMLDIIQLSGLFDQALTVSFLGIRMRLRELYPRNFRMSLDDPELTLFVCNAFKLRGVEPTVSKANEGTG